MKKYNHLEVEKKWKKAWEKNGVNKTKEEAGKPKYFVLDMFPYPSGAGLHVGHPKGYIATDIVARMKMMQGYNVLHPMGWDAFGLPAENYAIKNKVHPSVATAENIATFKKQLGLLGFTYDWEREVNTTDPKYYKWTQWAFIQMFKKGLAFESNEPINWCPSCKTGLANEDLEDGKCERCGSVVEQKPLRQWVLKITDYADRLLNDLDTLKDWPEPIKEMQRNWIGRSEGAEVKFVIKDTNEKLVVFTTRPDTLFGATYCVVAPEHEMLDVLKNKIENFDEIQKYLEASKKKSNLERTELQKEKTGIEIKGLKAINPANQNELPIFVADYVLGGYGTGAIMAVPAHDERDWEFAVKYNLPIKQVVAPKFVQADNPPQVGKSTKRRKTVHVILERASDGKVLMLKWVGKEWKPREPKTFIVGGVEDGEDIVLAATREIAEETGYTKVKFVKKLGIEVQTEYFAAHKDENRVADISVLHFMLNDDSEPNVSVEELAKHEPVWINRSEVGGYVNIVDGPFIWNWFLAGDKAYIGDGVVINSDFLNDLSVIEAKSKMINWLQANDIGTKKVQYKLRDWVFSRQRYWGEPIPLVHCKKCDWQPIPEDQLPLELPKVKNYEPSGTGESPLANIADWVNTTCPKCGGPAKRETNTMPQWAGSCWYYLRYIDPNNDKALVDKTKEKYWSPVDLYVGGAEHATRHLIYARFWHKFLFDIGVVNYSEPFTRLQNVGLILAEDGRKMSKRWSNVINPDDIVSEFGADAMRMYEMFMGPFDQPCAWSTQGVVGVRRFLEKVWSLSEKVANDKASDRLQNLLHKTIKKISSDIEVMHYNTSIAQMMTFINELSKEEKINQELFASFLQLLAPFAPHIAEELWAQLGHVDSIFTSVWPKFDASLAKDNELTLAVQINGKLRDTLIVSADISEEEAKKTVMLSEKIQKWLEGKELKKIIYVKGKLISIVV